MTRILFFIILVCTTLLNVSCRSKKYALKITHVTGNLYVYTSYGVYKGKHYPANAMYMVTKKGVILFDTPWQKKYFQPLLDSIRVRHHKKVIMVISTHWHQDRTAGLKYYASKGIKTYTSRQTDSLCVLHHKNRARFLIPRDTTFHIGEGSFQTYYPGPGHTMDNIVIWFPKQKLLYGGCFIKSTDVKTLGNIEDGNVKDWEQSLRRLQKKFPDPKYIITGHYSWRDKKSISHTLDMVEAYNKNHS